MTTYTIAALRLCYNKRSSAYYIIYVIFLAPDGATEKHDNLYQTKDQYY